VESKELGKKKSRVAKKKTHHEILGRDAHSVVFKCVVTEKGRGKETGSSLVAAT